MPRLQIAFSRVSTTTNTTTTTLTLLPLTVVCTRSIPLNMMIDILNRMEMIGLVMVKVQAGVIINRVKMGRCRGPSTVWLARARDTTDREVTVTMMRTASKYMVYLSVF